MTAKQGLAGSLEETNKYSESIFHCVAITTKLVTTVNTSSKNQYRYKTNREIRQKQSEEAYLQFLVLQRLFPEEAQIRLWCLQ